MRKLFTIFAVIAVALTACKSYDSDIEELNNRVDAITNTQIASLQEQVDAIESTLPALTSTNKELKAYIVELQASYDNLSVALEETNDKIAALKEELQGADAADKSDVLAQLEQIQSDLQSQLNSISNTISTLQTKDSELERQIAELREHVESIANGEGSVDWITATFATLEQHNALVSELSIVKGQIESVIQSIGLLESRLNDKIAADIAAAVAGLNSEIKQKVEEIIDSQNTAIAKSKSEVTAAYTEAIQVAIDASEVSLKKWVNEQLSGYCTLAELEARLVAISNACAQEDDKLRDEIKNLQDELKSATEQITKSYQSAIQDAITTNNGLINDKIAVEIAHINSKIDDQMESVRMSISSLEQRVGLLEAKIATIEEQIANIKSTISSLESVRDELRKNLADLVANGELTQKDIEALKAKDKELLEMILNLQVFVDQKLVGMKDWANATFATLDQYTSLLAELEFIKSTIANVDEEYAKAINEAIGRCESNMRRWVSDQLEGYCTVAELEGRLAALRNKITEGDESLQEEIDALTEALKDAKEELRSEYHAAITAAINNNNGVIDSKISSILSVVNSRINTEISAVNEKLAAIEQRLKRVEDEIASIRTQIGNIMSSIKELESAGAEIKNYVEYLASVDNNLRTEIGEVNEKIDSLEEEMKGEVSTAKAEVLAQLNAMRSYLDSKLTQITEAISALESKDKELDGKISALRSYVDDELNDTKDWAEATFATMEQYTALANEVASIKSYISSLNTAIKDLDSRLTEKINSDIAAAVATLNSSIQQKVKDITDGYTKAVADAKTEITAAYTAAIQSAIGALEVSMQSWVNEQLKGYYTIAEVQAMLAALESEFNDKLSEQKSYLEALINTLSQDVDGRIAANQSAIALLQKKLEELDNSVHTDIASRVAGNAKAIADNAKAIIANAEAIAANGDKITANQSNIEACRSLISKNSTLISENKSAIEELKSSTNGVLARLSTEIATNAEDIAKNSELIAKNAVAINSNSEAIAANTSDIAALNRDLATAKSEIKEAYEAAIAAAIASFDGKLSGEVAEQISAVNTRINSEVAAVNATIDELTTRLTTLEGEVDAIQQQIADMLQDITNMKDDIANLLKRIQSVTYIPKYSDGKATMNYQTKTTEFDFLVSPKSTVKDIAANWQSILSMKAVYTITRAVSFVDMPIISFEADETNGVITITVSGENLSEEFFTGTQEASAALHISDGNNSIVSAGIQIFSKIDIPDLALKKYFVDNYDNDGNGEISIAEAENITMVNCSGKGVSDLTGLKSCTNLVTLDCSNNNITQIELPNLAQLETVTCNDCPIEIMNFNGCTSLQYLNLQDATTNAIIGNKLHINKYNQAKSLTIDVSNTTLEHIFVCRSEILAYLDVSKNTQLTHLEVYVNPNLKSIDVSTLVNLEVLDLGDCDLTNLDVSKNLMLTELFVTNNKLSTIDVSQNKQLKVLKCKGNQISNLNVSNNDKLETLILEDNKLSAINVRNNTALAYLNINNNAEISMVDVQYNTSLKELYCNGLAIGELNIINNTALTKLECHTNKNLTTLTCNNAFDFTTTHISINKGLKIVSANGSVLTPSEGDLITVNLGTGVVFSTSSNGSFSIVSVSEASKRWYDAKTWCSDYGADWKFPSLNSLKSIYKSKSTINSTLSANGFTTLSTNYWSSTDDVGDEAVDSRYYAYRLSFSDGYSSSGSKNGSSKVRAVLAF